MALKKSRVDVELAIPSAVEGSVEVSLNDCAAGFSVELDAFAMTLSRFVILTKRVERCPR